MKSYKLSPLIFLILLQECFITSLATPEFPLPDRFKTSGETVFDKFDKLLEKYKPLNLGSGTPDFPPPKNLQTALSEAATSTDYSLSQYSPNIGHPRLLQAVSTLYSNLLGRTLDPNENVVITVGASEALSITILSHTFDGEEWIIFEPYYEVYASMIKAANGVAKFIKLKQKVHDGNVTSADWTFDKEELSNLFNEKTKGILLNTPNNPLGKVYSLDELTFIADLAKKWNVLVLADEVYQFYTLDDNKHISIASLPGMFERTVTVTSSGKMFGATGYSVGWAYGGAKLINNLKQVHGITVACASTPIQEAVAVALEDEIKDFGKPNSYFARLKQATESKRDYLYRILKDFGFTPVLPQAGFFMSANWTTIGDRVVLDTEENECEDSKFAKWLIQNVKVFGLPTSSFYKEVDQCHGKDLIRFTMIRAYETYKNAEELFSKW